MRMLLTTSGILSRKLFFREVKVKEVLSGAFSRKERVILIILKVRVFSGTFSRNFLIILKVRVYSGILIILKVRVQEVLTGTFWRK